MLTRSKRKRNSNELYINGPSQCMELKTIEPSQCIKIKRQKLKYKDENDESDKLDKIRRARSKLDIKLYDHVMALSDKTKIKQIITDLIRESSDTTIIRLAKSTGIHDATGNQDEKGGMRREANVGIMRIGPEILDIIFSLLSANDKIRSVELTCKYWRSASLDGKGWTTCLFSQNAKKWLKANNLEEPPYISCRNVNDLSRRLTNVQVIEYPPSVKCDGLMWMTALKNIQCITITVVGLDKEDLDCIGLLGKTLINCCLEGGNESLFDDALEFVEKCPNLTIFYPYNTIQDESLKYLKDLKNLTFLSLIECHKIRGYGLEFVPKTLTSLDINDTDLRQYTWPLITEFNQLVNLDLYSIGPIDSNMMKLISKMQTVVESKMYNLWIDVDFDVETPFDFLHNIHNVVIVCRRASKEQILKLCQIESIFSLQAHSTCVVDSECISSFASTRKRIQEKRKIDITYQTGKYTVKYDQDKILDTLRLNSNKILNYQSIIPLQDISLSELQVFNCGLLKDVTKWHHFNVKHFRLSINMITKHRTIVSISKMPCLEKLFIDCSYNSTKSFINSNDSENESHDSDESDDSDSYIFDMDGSDDLKDKSFIDSPLVVFDGLSDSKDSSDDKSSAKDNVLVSNSNGEDIFISDLSPKFQKLYKCFKRVLRPSVVLIIQ